MELMKEIIKQDIAAAIQAFEGDDFGLVNIMGNRLMSNLLLVGQGDLMIYGYLLKEASKEFERIRRMGKGRLEESKKIGRKFLEDLQAMVKDEVDARKVWERCYEYEKSIVKYLPTDFELAAYTENPRFTRDAALWLAKHLRENKELLMKEKNRLLNGVLNELSRIINTHGPDQYSLVLYLLLVSLADYYRYLSHMDVTEREEEFKQKIFPYVDEITSLDPESDLGELYGRANKILGDIASKWRTYFINYMEVPEIEIVERRPRIEIPEEAKERITKTIKEAIEKEAK